MPDAVCLCAARNEAHPGLYLRFLNNVVNDSIYLLDEAMKTLPEIKDKEAAVNGPEWAGMSNRQQQEHMCAPLPASLHHNAWPQPLPRGAVWTSVLLQNSSEPSLTSSVGDRACLGSRTAPLCSGSRSHDNLLVW